MDGRVKPGCDDEYGVGERRYGRVKSGSPFLLRFFRHAIEAILHVLHLTTQFVDVVVFGRALLFGLAARTTLRHERLEHREGLLEQLHVAADMLFERGEGRSAEGVGELLAKLLLLAGQ